jgi:hypothetical protein
LVIVPEAGFSKTSTYVVLGARVICWSPEKLKVYRVEVVVSRDTSKLSLVARGPPVGLAVDPEVPVDS